MRTELLMENGEKVQVQESYATIKRRLLDTLSFIEVKNRVGNSRLINKLTINGVTPLEKKK